MVEGRIYLGETLECQCCHCGSVAADNTDHQYLIHFYHMYHGRLKYAGGAYSCLPFCVRHDRVGWGGCVVEVLVDTTVAVLG